MREHVRTRWNRGARGLAIAATAVLAMSSVVRAETTTVEWGPIPVPAASGGSPGQVEGISGATGLAAFLASLLGQEVDIGTIQKPCENCYITSIRPNLVDDQGNLVNFVNGGMMHHVVVANVDAPDVTCRPGFSGLINLMGLFAGGNERFFASGNERTEFTEVPGYGYKVDSGDQWVLIYHLMNMTPNPRNYYFQMTFDHVSGGVTKTRPLWLDWDQCDDSEIDSPAGYSDANHWDWRIDRSGYVKTIGGHVHDQGISIAWENLDRGNHIWTSVAGYAAGSAQAPFGPGSGSDPSHPASHNTVASDPLGLASYVGHIADMTVGHPNARVKKNNDLRLHTQYNHSSAEGEGEGDMGIMIASLKEDFCITNFWCF